ncbi:MAG: hypothetical protein A4S09_04670 [Proteobacteria bacterium SG_bin7]|nr:MAG: hypothetical protein A4S09_04670 [Proteobacteria bacterium SG_bin7]
MKKIINIALLLAFIPLLSLAADEDKFSLSDTDKQLHMIASYGLTFTFTDIYRRMGQSKWKSLLWGSLSTLAIGTIKEITDPKFSGPDMAADAVGITIGAGVIISLDAIWEPQPSLKAK